MSPTSLFPPGNAQFPSALHTLSTSLQRTSPLVLGFLPQLRLVPFQSLLAQVAGGDEEVQAALVDLVLEGVQGELLGGRRQQLGEDCLAGWETGFVQLRGVVLQENSPVQVSLSL